MAEHREAVAEVIRDHTFHRQGDAETFACPASLYLSLLNEPAMTVALWKDLSDTPVQLQKVAAESLRGGRRVGIDGFMGVRVPLASTPRADVEFQLRQPARQRQDRRPHRA